MNETTEVIWTRIPIVGLPELACQLPLNEHGDWADANGEPLPLEQRQNLCGEEGVWILGRVPICRRHFPDVAAMAGDTAEAIEAAWKEQFA